MAWRPEVEDRIHREYAMKKMVGFEKMEGFSGRKKDEFDLLLVEGGHVIWKVLLNVGRVKFFNKIYVSIVGENIDQLCLNEIQKSRLSQCSDFDSMKAPLEHVFLESVLETRHTLTDSLNTLS